MQRAADKQELEAQPAQKKPRFLCYPDRISDAVRQALYDAESDGPLLNDQPIVMWCIENSSDGDGGHTALLYWPCNQLVGESVVRAMCYSSYSGSSARHSRLIKDMIALALGRLSDYKAAKPKHSQYADMKRRVVERFLLPGQPLSALGQWAMMIAEGNIDTQPYACSKHSNGCLNECELNPRLFYAHTYYTASSGIEDTVDDTSDSS